MGPTFGGEWKKINQSSQSFHFSESCCGKPNDSGEVWGPHVAPIYANREAPPGGMYSHFPASLVYCQVLTPA